MRLIQELADGGVRPIEPEMRLAREIGIDLAHVDVRPDDRIADVARAVEAAGWRPGTELPRGIGSLQRGARAVGGWALRWWFDLRVSGAGHVPRTGPAILAMNHESALDIPIAVVACPRPITFMAKRELFKNAFVSWALTGLGGFRVDRARYDQRAVAAALAALAAATCSACTPRGRAPGTLLPFVPGAAWLALRTGALLAPCSVAGTEQAKSARAPGRVRVRVEFHDPIPVANVEDPAERRRLAGELTARVRVAVEAGLRR